MNSKYNNDYQCFKYIFNNVFLINGIRTTFQKIVEHCFHLKFPRCIFIKYGINNIKKKTDLFYQENIFISFMYIFTIIAGTFKGFYEQLKVVKNS